MLRPRPVVRAVLSPKYEPARPNRCPNSAYVGVLHVVEIKLSLTRKRADERANMVEPNFALSFPSVHLSPKSGSFRN